MIYFDHAATTPISPKVLRKMNPYFSVRFGNASSIYSLGREAKTRLEEARVKAANIIGAKPGEIIFTSGATEANNLALKGSAFFYWRKTGVRPHLIISLIEHHSVLDTARWLRDNFDFELTEIAVSQEGIVDPKEVERAIKENTTTVSIMSGNNEVGSIQPIAEIGQLIQKINKNRTDRILFHTDAVQSFQYLNTKVNELNVDMLSLTAHKFSGPKGIGLLFVREGTKLLPLASGGSQERKLRAGTENVPYIIGMVEAMEQAEVLREETRNKVSELRDYLIKRVMEKIPDVVLTGPTEKTLRLPHIASFIFKKIEGESILIHLDSADICASSGSACTSGSLESSHVLMAMGYDDFLAHGSIRLSLGKLNKREDIDELMKILPEIAAKLTKISPIK